MKRSFLVQIDTDDMEYHAAFDPHEFADHLLNAAGVVAKKQKLGVMDIKVNYLGAVETGA